MGFRFRKRIKLMPGVHLNLSKSGVSTSVGRNGATVNLRPGKIRGTVGIPGSGLSYSQETKSGARVRRAGGEDGLLEPPAVRKTSVIRAFFRGLGFTGSLLLFLFFAFALVMLWFQR
ncbi:MAG: DUF4236 domain-containing protein [Variovorax sp.]|nr:DUF4236 domain-containing protein [Variovorax sp.]|tara:strand:- start:243 stop:593 length:351 start_codon:yes stop_codon:yes gene_type:complete